MIGQDDTRLTTYVVDDVDDATRADVEAALAASDSLTHEADEIREMAQLLGAALSHEPAPALRAEQRRMIEEAARFRPQASRAGRLARVLCGLAALLAIVVGTVRYSAAKRALPGPVNVADRGVVIPLPPLPSSAPSSRPLVMPPAMKKPPKPVPSTPREVVVAAEESVDVDGQSAPVMVSSGDLSGVVTAEQVQALPLNGRNFLQLALLMRGITAPEANVNVGQDERFNTEAYAYRADNDFLAVVLNPLSTFSIDVDTASYANVRRFLNEGTLPPKDAVRIEEMVNYFPYDYEPPHGKDTFTTHVEMAPAPWNKEHRLLRIGLKAREIPHGKRPDSNLVFLIDVSGSMDEPNKLPLVKRSLQLLVEQLTERDRVAIVVYAGAAGCVLPPTSGGNQAALQNAIERLQAGGSTNGAQGIQLAYQLASAELIKGGVNRVILATDGDFNVGVTDQGSLVRLIEEKAKLGVFLSVFGFGMGNYKDQTLELLADKGNGNYGYIDTLNEARKALVEQMDSTLVTVAKDVKIQVEWNPTRVQSYRLIGYENRLLRPEEFSDDKKDAGEVGAGHSVTALYEIVPVTSTHKRRDADEPSTEPLVYQKPAELTSAAKSDELMHLKLRYKEPEGSKSRLEEWPIRDRVTRLDKTSTDFRFAASVAAFGMFLRDSVHKGAISVDGITALAREGLGRDAHGYRAEFLTLVQKARELKK